MERRPIDPVIVAIVCVLMLADIVCIAILLSIVGRAVMDWGLR